MSAESIDELKRQVADLQTRLQEREAELDEFQESSRQLEEELETQLTASEKRNAELSVANERLAQENEQLKERLAEVTQTSSIQIEQLTSALQDLQKKNKVLFLERRELEQKNDDFERSTRNLSTALEDFKDKLNEQIEKNVFLELELGEKGVMEDTIQRLKDYVKDLELELRVQQQQRGRGSISSGTGSSLLANVVNRRSTSLSTPPATPPTNGQVTTNGHHHQNGSSSAVSPANSSPAPSNVSIDSPATVISSPSSRRVAARGIPLPKNSLTSPPSSTTFNYSQLNPLNKSSTGSKGTSNVSNNNLVNSNNNFNHRSSPPTSPSAANTRSLRYGGGGGIPTLQHSASVPAPHPPPLLSPTTRTSALNIVSDLLRKVGALESKLASCRNLVPPTSVGGGGSPVRTSFCNKSTNVTPVTSPVKERSSPL